MTLARSAKAALTVLALATAATTMTLATMTPALADLASDKAAVDAAKAAGTVGEQGDGFLGFVNGSPGGALAAAVKAINDGRAGVYAQTAAKSGVSAEAAGQATGAQLIARTPAGEYIKPLGASWKKK